MIKINKKVEYSLMALKYITQRPSDQLTSAREICDSLQTPFDTTAKVLQTMNQHGLLKSTKGIKGGYHLAKPLSKITYRELARVIESKENPDSFCQSAKGVCELYDSCNIVGPIEQLNKKINFFLETLTLEELLLNENFCHGVSIRSQSLSEKELL